MSIAGIVQAQAAYGRVVVRGEGDKAGIAAIREYTAG